jgi:ABC-2 type transport system ATP-binding protein
MTHLDGGLAVEASELSKHYGEAAAVQAIDLAIPQGEFFGLLGPNGAGKTSTIHMLSSLIAPSAGAARVAGFDLRSQRLEIRRRIGVVFQGLALDLSLSAAENLRFAGRLNGLRSAEIERRSDELLALFGLEKHRHAPAAALSGGMRRALDIARGVIHRPRILFLDEPTSGLDLLNRRAIWRHIAELRSTRGMTVFLTTHYLEEAADCDAVAFLNAGRIVLRGKPGELVDTLGRCLIEVETDQPMEVARRLEPRLGAALIEPDQVSFACEREPADLAVLERELGGAARALRWRRPNLNDVFLRINQPHARRRAA